MKVIFVLLTVYLSLYADRSTSLPIDDLTLILSLAVFILSILLLITFNITRRTKKEFKKRLEKVHVEAIEAERAKDTFLANVSHETRTPMTAIIGLSHILLQSDLNSTQKQSVRKIKHSAEHLLAITNDILDYSKIEAGKLEINAANFETNPFFTNLADMMGLQAVEKGIDLVFDISYRLPDTLVGDALRISQVLINLLNNAIKFTDRGQIILRVFVVKQKEKLYDICFEVNDTGIGLTPEQIQKLFHAFDQADNKISRKYGGTGLGLAISQELVEKMHGELKVKSTFREGSTFYFTLPLHAPENNINASDKHIQRTLFNKSILILERNQYTNKMLSNTLHYYKAMPHSIFSLEALYAQLHAQRYDALFLDSRFITQIEDMDLLYKQCDVIIILNYEILSTALTSKIKSDAILNKPFTYQTLLQTVTTVFGKSITVNEVQKRQITLEDLMVLKGSHILLAEDNEGNTMVVEGLLEGSGIELTAVTNGQKAVEAVFNGPNKIELILMDINMPGMDGYVATSIIREYQKYDNIPIIAMTANITQSDIDKSKNFGMQAHLSKPIDVNAFYETLLRFIKPKISVEESKKMMQKESKTANVSISLDTLPNIDIQDGLSRLNNNTKAYQNVLFKFCDMFHGVISTLSTAVSEHNYEEGRAIAHNLKGLSGNIGAKEIYSLAQELEDSFKDGEGEFNALINAIERKLIPLIEGIRKLKAHTVAPEAVAKNKISLKTKVALLSELYQLAKKKKAVQIKKSCQILETYQWEEDQKEIDAIIQSAKSYQFKAVCESIEKLLPGIQSTKA